MMRLLWLMSLFVIFEQPVVTPKPAGPAEIQEVEFCEVLANPHAYDQKVIRTRAIYRYGGEDTNDVYCPECLGPSWGWVRPTFADSYESCTKRDVAKKLSREEHDGGTVKVTLVGKFFAGNKGDKSYHLEIECVEKADYLYKDSHLPGALPDKPLKRVRC